MLGSQSGPFISLWRFEWDIVNFSARCDMNGLRRDLPKCSRAKGIGADIMVRGAKRSMVDELEAMLDVVDPELAAGGRSVSLKRRTFDMSDGVIQKKIAEDVACLDWRSQMVLKPLKLACNQVHPGEYGRD